MRQILVLVTNLLWVASVQPAATREAIQTPVAKTQSGRVSGERTGEVDVFRGIPYAAAPVGERRWAAPATPAAWRGTRRATVFGPSCPQPEVPAPFGAEGPKSEDCLYLNIWRPKIVSGAHLPVLVWLHGGAFLLGSGSQPLYDGSELARRGAIVVTINYRLGALGFLNHRAFVAQDGPSANFGLLDQIAALRWVKHNIAGFGGDPRNVTLAGESAGGVSVQALMTSAAARGLFGKAIIQSGGGLAAFADSRSEAALAAGDKWAQSVGAPTNATIADLRKLPVERLVAARFIAFPSIDDALLDRNPAETFARGEEADVPLLIGANSWEASLRIFDDAMARSLLGPAYDPLLQSYLAAGLDKAAAADRLRGDLFFVQPARFLAERHARNHPTWLYHFDMLPASLRGKQPGTAHGGELAYLFATPAAGLVAWDDQDRAVSQEMMDYWTRFAASGNPNASGSDAWQDARTGDSLLIQPTARMTAPTEQDYTAFRTVVAAARGWLSLDQRANSSPSRP